MDSPTSSVDQFRFQPEKISVGTVYHYLKTNIDGTTLEHISLYVAAQDRLEAFKFHPGGNRAALVIAEMDWSIYTTKTLDSWQVYAGGKKVRLAIMTYLDVEQAVQTDAPGMDRSSEETELLPIAYLPFHMYNFDLSSLNFAFRHLRDPQSNFSVGLIDPNFKEDGPLIFYRGEVTVRYLADELRNERPSRKYRIDGPGLEDRGGFIWVNKAGEHVEDMEIDLPDNANWQSFKFALQSIEQIDSAAWEGFMAAQF